MTRAEYFYYPNGVPRNRLGLDDAEALARIERDLSTWRMEEVRAGEAPEATRGNFDLEHLKAIHQHSFQDVYEWAGVTRSEPMEIEGNTFEAAPLLYKGEESQVPFVPSHQVNSTLERTFGQLRQDNYLQGLPREEFADKAAQVFSDINAAHAFMEGNGRIQREFMEQLGRQAGHPLNFEVVSGYRMREVSEQARLGEMEGMCRMFQEITDQGRVAVLERANQALEHFKINWQERYVMTAVPGQDYTGTVAVAGPGVVVMRSENTVLAARPRDLEPTSIQGGREVSFTASTYPAPVQQEQQRRMDMEM